MTRTKNALELVIQQRARVLVCLPNTNELQRFILANAFSELEDDHDFFYVVPVADEAKMMAAAPDKLTPDNTFTLDVPKERFEVWSKMFGLACQRLGNRSRSFAIRAGLHQFDPKNPETYARFPESLRKFVSRLLKGGARSTFMPVQLRRKFSALASVIDDSVLAEVRRGQDVRSYSKEVDALLAGMQPLERLVEILDEVKPLYVVIPTSLLDLFCNDVLLACSTEKVASLILQSGWDNLSSKGIIHHLPTGLLTWGPQSTRHATEIQLVPAAQVAAVGAPHYEFLQTASPEQVDALRASLGIGKEEKLILFGGSFRQFDETSTLLRLEAAIDKGLLPPLKILYRPHPWRADREGEDDFFQHTWKHVIFDPDIRERYVRARIEKGYLKRAVPMFDMAYLAQVLSAVDAVISPMSTLLLESMIMDLPTMAIAFGDGIHAHNPSVTAQMTHFEEIKDNPALVWCDDSGRLEADVRRLLEPEQGEKASPRRTKLLDSIVIRTPDTYARRLSDYCRNVLEPRARKMRAEEASRRRGSISHAYGANLIARDYCGLHMPEPQIPGYWMHGWIPAYHNMHPALIALHKKDGQGANYDFESQIRDEMENTGQWVSRKDQADFLRSHGHKHVRSIGLPIVYITDKAPARVPGSLLVMPPHSHKNHGADDPLAESYAELIASYRSKFDQIWVCLHEDDLAKRQWVDSFRSRGIGVFPSADQSDPFTLRRLKSILSSFEYVTTNGYGSHIALAAYCGAKVSVFGPFAEFPYDRMARTHAVKMFPELQDMAYELCTEAALKRNYPHLFCEPDKAVQQIEWGQAEVGEDQKLSPEELRRLFQWEPKTGTT